MSDLLDLTSTFFSLECAQYDLSKAIKYFIALVYIYFVNFANLHDKFIGLHFDFMSCVLCIFFRDKPNTVVFIILVR